MEGPMQEDVEQIRLQVRYESDRELLTEYTSCLTRGGCLLHTKKELDVGTEFLLEMASDPNFPATNVRGKVVRVPRREDDYEVAVQYVADEKTREALEVVLARVMVDSNQEYVRRQPRIPVNLVCVDNHNTRYLVRDVSRGGMGIVLPRESKLPADVEIGTLLSINLGLNQKSEVQLAGHVAWIRPRTEAQRAAFGVQFHIHNDTQRMVVLGLTHLLRPETILLQFFPGQTFDPRAFEEFAVSRAPLFDLPLIAMQRAVAHINRHTGATLTGKKTSKPVEWGTRETFSAGVTFKGALAGEIWIKTDMNFATRLSRIYLPDDTNRLDLMRDSLMELLSTIAGQMGDELEVHGYAIDVIPPKPGAKSFETFPGQQVTIYELTGVDAPVELTVVNSAPVPNL